MAGAVVTVVELHFEAGTLGCVVVPFGSLGVLMRLGLRATDTRQIEERTRMKLLVAVLVFSTVACAAPPASQARGVAPEFLNSGRVLPVDLPFSEAVRVGDTLYLSGMIGVVLGKLELVPGGMEVEAEQTMNNIKMVLETHGYRMDDVVKCTVMLADIAEWGAFNEVYKTFFADRYPARSALGVNGLALGARVEVECLAVKTEHI
jgi:reactive intermediate/imine deaminase